MKYLCLLLQFFFQAYLIWVPELDVPKQTNTAVQTDLKYPLKVHLLCCYYIRIIYSQWLG